MPAHQWKNKLYFGDNLDILREHIADESVDLIYLDPPFNSDANYNVLFKETTGEQSSAQITAFEDTWHWSEDANAAYHELLSSGHEKLASLVESLHILLGPSDMSAYLVMMAQRLVELHRVLKPSGSLYLHCDPTASHYLKIVLDVIFGPRNFRNEIIWKRTSAHSSSERYGPVHDVILFYGKSDEKTWNPQYRPYDETYIESFYRNVDQNGRRYTLGDLTGAGIRHGDTGEEWHGINPTSKGRHWMMVRADLDKLEANGRIYFPKKKGGIPRGIRYLDEMPGVPLQDVWSDILPIGSQAAERLGYPTQKPESLLERIILSSSSKGDVILDPFCGCGTAVHVAEKTNRRWIGVDVTHIAITLIRHRLQDAFKSALHPFEVIGDPKDLQSAGALALEDRYQFQWWALGLVDARPAYNDRKKGSDGGVDGVIRFFTDAKSKTPRKIVIQVKSGHVTAGQIRDLIGVTQREKAEIGIFITLEKPTAPMNREALEAGYYTPEQFANKYRRIQIITIEELLAGKMIDYPRYSVETFKKAKSTSKGPKTEQKSLFE